VYNLSDSVRHRELTRVLLDAWESDKKRMATMAKPIELETVFRGDSARVFNEYLDSPRQPLTPESQAVLREAHRLSKEWPK
jgi:hypothetical protein